MFRRFLIKCQNEKCGKVILRENPAIKFIVGNKPQFSCSDIDTGEIVVMPNVWCKHCKHKNLFTWDDCIETSGKTIIEKKLLAKRIREDLSTIEKKILDDVEANGEMEEGENLGNGVPEVVKEPIKDTRPVPQGLVLSAKPKEIVEPVAEVAAVLEPVSKKKTTLPKNPSDIFKEKNKTSADELENF